MRRGIVAIGKDLVDVLGVDFATNRIQVDPSQIEAVVQSGGLVTNEGAAPKWRWLKGKGGYNDSIDVWTVRHAVSKIVLEIGYGCLRIRPRPGQKVRFCTHEGELMEDSGMSWNET